MEESSPITQEIKYIKVKKLVLWTENPRDPIDPNASDQDVVDRATSDPNNKWDLLKLAREMSMCGYDYSELPTVVMKEGKPIVYDGNRRIVIAKIKLGYAHSEKFQHTILPNIPESIPCNVCSEETALKNIYRKHVVSRNTWSPLERDIFANKYFGEDKSIFLKIEECTNGFISSHPSMNQGFVRNEIFTESILNEMGFALEKDNLTTQHSDEEVGIILHDILDKVERKIICTRGQFRGKPNQALDQRTKEIISGNKNNPFHRYYIQPKTKENPTSQRDTPTPNEKEPTPRKTRITNRIKIEPFGEKLILNSGDVNNLYSDIVNLYSHIENNKSRYSPNINALFRMSLRLLCETAAGDMNCGSSQYIKEYYPLAKKTLSQDTLTTLSTSNVDVNTLPQLLNIGAHNYTICSSHDSALAISIAIGAMLKISHGK